MGAVSDIISSAAGGIGGMIGAIISKGVADDDRELAEEQYLAQIEAERQNVEAVNKSNESIADKTNALNKQIADMNLGFQRENLEYQKALQQQIFEREDTAYQRTASDMASAGLNPLTMQGTNSSGDVVSTESMHNDMVVQGWTAEKSETAQIQRKIKDFNTATDAFNSVLNTLTKVSDSMSNLQSGFAQRDLLRGQKQGQDIDNAIKIQNQGYISPYFANMKYFAPTDENGVVIAPLDFQGWNDKKAFYNPGYRFINSRIAEERQRSNDMQYGLFNNSTDWERNMTSFERSLDSGRFNTFAEKIGDSAQSLLWSLFGALNKN